MYYPKVLERVDFPEQIFHRSFSLGAPVYSYFDTDCPTKVTMLIGILGSDSLELLGRGSQCLGKKNRRRKKKV